MYNPVLPKEQLTAYQRWELAALAEGKLDVADSRSKQETMPALPTAAEIERIRQTAHAEGLAEGRARAAEIATQLESLLRASGEELRIWEERIAEDVLALALELARQVLRQALPVRRELVVPVVREAMRQMPFFNSPARLVLHSEDAAVVREQMSDQIRQMGWAIIEDETIERGGCKIESTATRVDATNQVRWERVIAALGSDLAWLERAPSQNAATVPKEVA